MKNISETLDALAYARTPAGLMVDLGRRQMNCDRHGPYMAKGTGLTRRDFWAPCDQCRQDREQAEAAAKAAKAAQEHAARMEERLRQSAIPARFLGRTLDNYAVSTEPQRKAVATVRRYLQDFPTNYRAGLGLVLAGKPGTGKSHLATALLQAVMPQFFGVYVTASDYLIAARASWGNRNDERSESEVLEEYSRVSLLVLDEVGMAFGSQAEQKQLFDLLDRRYREELPTIILTNEDAAGLRRFLGERIFDRLLETSEWVPFAWPSYRATARKEALHAE